MPRILRGLKITDVSSVDIGAGRGVKVVLTKRDANALKKHSDGVPDIYGKPLAFGQALNDETLAYLKREFSDKERQESADRGHAMAGGGYPIENVGDLKNAIQAIGRAKDPAKTKAHIKSRAKDLGREDLIPDSWSKRLVTKAEFMAEFMNIAERNALACLAKNAMDFGDAYERLEVAEDVGCLMDELREAMCALDCSIQSIISDDDITEKRPSIEASFKQFQRYIAGRELEQHDPEGEALASKRDKDMTTAVSPAVQKIIDDAVAAAVDKAVGEKDKEIAKRDEEIAVLKMSDKQRQYFGSMTDDDEKKRFKAMSSDERDAYMNKMAKRAEDDPIVKGLRAQVAELEKRLNEADSAKELEVAKRDAREMGMAQADAGEVLMKARRGDKDAMKEYEKRMVAVAKSGKAMERLSKAFDELGHNQRTADGRGVSAIDEFNALAADLRKKEPKLSPQQAFAKVYDDPANQDLRKRENDERFGGMGMKVA